MNKKIEIPHCDLKEKEEKYFAEYEKLKKNSEFDKALKLLDYIQQNCYDIRRKFVGFVVVNGQRSVIYNKMKNKELSNYYSLLGIIGDILNNSYYVISGKGMLESYYFTNKFYIENELANMAVKEYINWFKPIHYKLQEVLAEIKKEKDETYLNYKCTNLYDLEVHLFNKNEKLNTILKEIDSNPFDIYYKKHLSL